MNIYINIILFIILLLFNIPQNLFKIKYVGGKKYYNISTIKPLFYTRFDLMAKYLYIKYKDIDSIFFKELYKKHIITFNNCWEYPGTKTTMKDFIESFDLLIENMKNNKFNEKYPIIISKNNLLINGSHRLTLSYFYNIKPVFIKTNKIIKYHYNYNFFNNRKIYPKLDKLYSDTMALEFVKLNPNIRVMITYPNINNKFNILENIIREYGYLYYKKTIKLNNNGINNLIKELYRNEKWIGGLFPKGMNPGNKYNYCKGDNHINIYLIHINNLDKLIELKEKCRKLYNLGKHSLHMTDYKQDTFRVASSLLNENSIHFLNNGTNDLSEKTKITLEQYFNKLNNNNENYCITSSVIMEIYNLRKAKDVDYLHKNDNILNIKNIGIHNNIWLSYYTKTKDDIIYNPKNHFYFNGFKFASLNIIKKMKEKRNTIKDINDLKLF